MQNEGKDSGASVRRAKRVQAMLCFVGAAAVLLALCVGLSTRNHSQVRRFLHPRHANPMLRSSTGISQEEGKARKIYPFSIVPGGVYSSEELARSRRIDPVVAKHYAGFGGSISIHKTVRDNFMYVSYRKKDRVYWTQTKHRIPGGEYVLTDGKNFARARCGNRLSPVPQEPIAEAGEPDANGLDKPEPPENTYLADVEPFNAPPLFAAPPSTDSEPFLNVLNNVPKTAVAPTTSLASNEGDPFFGGRGIGSTVPFPRVNNLAASAANQRPSAAGAPRTTNSGASGDDASVTNPGDTGAASASVATPEASSWRLLVAGAIGLFFRWPIVRVVLPLSRNS